jgi:hypothetical protein
LTGGKAKKLPLPILIGLEKEGAMHPDRGGSGEEIIALKTEKMNCTEASKRKYMEELKN